MGKSQSLERHIPLDLTDPGCLDFESTLIKVIAVVGDAAAVCHPDARESDPRDVCAAS